MKLVILAALLMAGCSTTKPTSTINCSDFGMVIANDGRICTKPENVVRK